MDTMPDKAQNEKPAGRDERRAVDKQQQNIQDAFLNSARRDKTPLTVRLTGGITLTGRIRSFDKYSVVLENNNQEQLIFKHAIAMIGASRPGAPLGAASSLNASSEPSAPSSPAGPADQKQHPEG